MYVHVISRHLKIYSIFKFQNYNSINDITELYTSISVLCLYMCSGSIVSHIDTGSVCVFVCYSPMQTQVEARDWHPDVLLNCFSICVF